MKLSVDATGVTHLREAFDRMGPKAVRRGGELVRKAAHNIESLAKRKVPVDTGYLQSSIGVTMGEHDLVATIGPFAHYGAHVEYGTAKRRPRPYLMPAFDAVKPSFEAAVDTLAKGLLDS